MSSASTRRRRVHPARRLACSRPPPCCDSLRARGRPLPTSPSGRRGAVAPPGARRADPRRPRLRVRHQRRRATRAASSSGWSASSSCCAAGTPSRSPGWSFFTTVEWRTDTDPPTHRRARAAHRHGARGADRGDDRHPARRPAPRSSSPTTRRPGLREAADQPGRPARRHPQPALRHLGLPASSATQIVPLSEFLTDHFGWIPIFATEEDASLTGSMFIAGIVVSLMVLPIIASVTREVFAQTPPAEKEAALALGGTRWGMVRTVVLPYGKGGIIGGSMLGLGRALGRDDRRDAPAAAGARGDHPHPRERRGHDLGFIAQRAGGDDFTVSGLMAAGLVLFVMTLATNMIASVDHRPVPLGRRGRGLMTVASRPRRRLGRRPGDRAAARAAAGPGAGVGRRDLTRDDLAHRRRQRGERRRASPGWSSPASPTAPAGSAFVARRLRRSSSPIFALVTTDRLGRLAGDRSGGDRRRSPPAPLVLVDPAACGWSATSS